jgi:hypothetical protein
LARLDFEFSSYSRNASATTEVCVVPRSAERAALSREATFTPRSLSQAFICKGLFGDFQRGPAVSSFRGNPKYAHHTVVHKRDSNFFFQKTLDISKNL